MFSPLYNPECLQIDPGGSPSGCKSQQYSGKNHGMILMNKSFTRACPPGSFPGKGGQVSVRIDRERCNREREYASYSTGKFSQFIIEQRNKHMEERDERDAPEIGKRSFLGGQAVSGKPAHTESKEDKGTRSESTQNLHFPTPDLQL